MKMEEKILDKKIKAGMKKCPIHRFGADYLAIGKGWYQCEKCKAYIKIEDCEEERIHIEILNIKLK